MAFASCEKGEWQVAVLDDRTVMPARRRANLKVPWTMPGDFLVIAGMLAGDSRVVRHGSRADSDCRMLLPDSALCNPPAWCMSRMLQSAF
jgi:hypothetical protein